MKETPCKSRRNRVVIKEDSSGKYVVKTFASASCLQTEYEVLTALKNQNVPKILKKNQNELVLSYIDGTLLSDVFLFGTLEAVAASAKALGEFLNEIATVLPNRCLCDCNFRNFILSQNGDCFGLDFEEVETGDMATSVATLAAFAAFYPVEPAKTHAFCSALFETCHFFPHQPAHKALLKQEVLRLTERRKILANFDAVFATIVTKSSLGTP